MKIPNEVKKVIEQLKEKGFDAYIIGGCVRDLLRGKEPKDWDLTTNAKPEEIIKIFPKTFYENKFLTVTVQTENEDPKLKEIEITTYRSESKYTNKRHPDEISFAETLEEDLARRDFTVNALAMATKTQSAKCKVQNNNLKLKTTEIEIIDLFDGQKDLKSRIIRAVGDPEKRFDEDALRMLRAVRFATVLDFSIEEKTKEAIKKNALWLERISNERIRDEFIKIINNKRAAYGVELLRSLGLLTYIIPELEEGCGVAQNKHHIYDCYEHNLRALGYAAETGFNEQVRIAALLHDVGKPRTKHGRGESATFYNHEMVGARMTKQILGRLKFSKKDVEKITKLVRYHLFYYNVGEVSDSSVRRLVRQVGLETIEELLQLRMSDRIGSGVPKAEPYKLRHLKYVIEKVSKDPISVKMLKIGGEDIIKILKITPGPKIGQVLDILLGYVLEDPQKNKKEFLEKKALELSKLSEKELNILAQKAKQERVKVEKKEDKMTKQKYWVT